MKKYHINYSHGSYINSQKINSQTALKIGGFDESIPHGYNNLDSEFISKNTHILNKARGAGYWLWKPYIIHNFLKKMDYGDVLCYTDSGCEFIKSADNVISRLENTNNGLLLFELNSNFINKHLTKRDTFHYMNLDEEPFLSSVQILASFVFIKKNVFTINFVEEWLSYCEDYRIITDSPNESGLPNYDGFVDHRHDQSVLSLLGKKYNISTIPDISQYGNDRRDSKEQIINHTRNR